MTETIHECLSCGRTMQHHCTALTDWKCVEVVQHYRSDPSHRDTWAWIVKQREGGDTK